MGGYDTMITEKTRNIVIESAWWDPGIVRKMSRRHGTAHRCFAPVRAWRGFRIDRAVLRSGGQMILESGGGELVGDVVDVISKKMDQAPVVLHVSEVRRILGGSMDCGADFPPAEAARLRADSRGAGRRAVSRAHSELAARCGARDRRDRRDRAAARLRQVCEYSARVQWRGGRVAARGDGCGFARRALALGYNEAISLTFISHADAEKFSPSALGDGAGAGESAERRSVGDAHVAGAGHARHAGVELEPRCARGVGCLKWAAYTRLSGGERVEPKRACLGATLGGGEEFVAGGRRAGREQGGTCARGGGLSRIQGRRGEFAGGVCCM